MLKLHNLIEKYYKTNTSYLKDNYYLLQIVFHKELLLLLLFIMNIFINNKINYTDNSKNNEYIYIHIKK